jgi:hypothetical protein
MELIMSLFGPPAALVPLLATYKFPRNNDGSSCSAEDTPSLSASSLSSFSTSTSPSPSGVLFPFSLSDELLFVSLPA